MILPLVLFYFSICLLSRCLGDACCPKSSLTETPIDDITTYMHGCLILIENHIQVQYKLFDLLETTSTGATFKGAYLYFINKNSGIYFLYKIFYIRKAKPTRIIWQFNEI